MYNQGVFGLLVTQRTQVQRSRIIVDRLVAFLDFRLYRDDAVFLRVMKGIEQNRGDHLHEAALIERNSGVDLSKMQVQMQLLIFRFLVTHLNDAPESELRIERVNIQLEGL